jgi:hypothetical protein
VTLHYLCKRCVKQRDLGVETYEYCQSEGMDVRPIDQQGNM